RCKRIDAGVHVHAAAADLIDEVEADQRDSVQCAVRRHGQHGRAAPAFTDAPDGGDYLLLRGTRQLADERGEVLYGHTRQGERHHGRAGSYRYAHIDAGARELTRNLAPRVADTNHEHALVRERRRAPVLHGMQRAPATGLELRTTAEVRDVGIGHDACCDDYRGGRNPLVARLDHPLLAATCDGVDTAP